MQERMRDLRWPLVTAVVVVAAMFAAFTVTRSDASTPPRSTAPHQTIQSESTPAPRPGDDRDCPEHDGHGHGGGEQGSAPQTAPSTPSAPSTSGTDL